MNHQLHSDITARLERDYGFKASGDWLRKGACPACSQKSLFTHAAHPWVLRCERSNKCGVEYHVKDLFSDLFESWGDRYKATPAAPNAAADAYLQSARGFDLARIAGWYQQENYWDAEKKIGSATVRFALTPPGTSWERIIDRPDRFGDRKATFRGKYAGTWWQPPTLTDIPAELWIVEGVFDAIAWLHHDVAAVAAMSCNNYPAASLAELAARCEAEGVDRPKLVWGLDGDRAGRRYAKQWVKKSREQGWEATAAVIAFEGKAKLDWNDMHQRGRLEKKDIEDYRYQGALLLAESAQEKALLMYRRHGWHAFSFGLGNKLWWFKLDLEKFHKACDLIADQDKDLTKDQVRDKGLLEAGLVTEVANFLPTALYHEQNKLTNEAWYYFRVDFPHDGPAEKLQLTPAQATKVQEFKSQMFHAAGAFYTASAAQHDIMMKRWTEGIKKVEAVNYIGYSPVDKERKHGCWVFNDVAVKDGKMFELNEEDFFDIGRLSIKSLSKYPFLTINTDLKEFSTDWLGLLWQCYHHKGIAALAFWLGSLFAVQIRQRYKSFPFIELVGEPGAGKSTLIEFLWRLLGRTNYEGFDPVKATMVARARNFMQVSNLPVVLIEGDRTEDNQYKQKGFDWDELKPVYDGRSVYSRGVKNSGNETIEPPFLGALAISQNAPVAASDAIMQRILHISFDLASHTPESKLAADALWQVGVENLSGFILKATLAEKAVLATFEERMPMHEKALLKLTGVRNRRIAMNHAMLAALVDALAHVVPLGAVERQQTQAFIEDMAAERQEAINADHQVVQEFWDIYDFLNGDDEVPVLNHARKGEAEIAINLNHFVAVAADRRQQIPELRDLKKLLRTSRVRKFIDIKPVNSVINDRYNKSKSHPDAPDRPATVKCWVFQAAPRNT